MQPGQTNYIPLSSPLVCYYADQAIGQIVGLSPSYVIAHIKEEHLPNPKSFALKVQAPTLDNDIILDVHLTTTQEPETYQAHISEKSKEDLNRLISRTRKQQHINICKTQNIESSDRYTGFENLGFIPKSLPSLSWSDINTETHFLGYKSQLPILISGMTGGVEQGTEINRRLARAAQYFKIPMGVGSQRIALEHPEYEKIFQVKSESPDVFLIANLGIGQLTNKKDALKYAQKAISMIDANALALHVNLIQELVQSEGDRNFNDLADTIHFLCEQLDTPIIIKEVGCGIDLETAQELYEAGVRCIDVGGRGGTSWAYIESKRNQNKIDQTTGEIFRDWGIPTAHALAATASYFNNTSEQKDIQLIATGGIRNGLTIAKALGLGATICGIGLPLFKAALEDNEDSVFEVIESYKKQLKTVMLATNSVTLKTLGSRLTHEKPYLEYIDKRLSQLQQIPSKGHDL